MEEVVYHVSNNGEDGESGIFRPRAFRIRYPYIHKVFTEQGADYVQFDGGDGNVIVTEEPADKFRDHVITHS
jgi:hypothetical protein